MPLEDKLTLLVLYPLSVLLPLAVHEHPPAPVVDLALVVEYDVVVTVDAKISAVFVFLYLKLSLGVVDLVYLESVEQLGAHLDQLVLGCVVVGEDSDDWHRGKQLVGLLVGLN